MITRKKILLFIKFALILNSSKHTISYHQLVNKMNLKTLFISLLFCATTFQAQAATDISKIRTRNYVACGTNNSYPFLATKQQDSWQGFDADICRAFSFAVFGTADKFKLINIKNSQIGQALSSGQIDIMLGNTSLSAEQEIALKVMPVATLYYDRQIFASRTPTNATSMTEFTGSKVCVLRNSAFVTYLTEYNLKHALDFKLLEMPSTESIKSAFFTNRCPLVSASEIFIKTSILTIQSSQPPQILPEQISFTPLKAYISQDNPNFSRTAYWILNALKLAAQFDITSQNINTFAATKNRSLQNLLGYSPELWKSMGLYEQWAQKYISLFGNYEQILDKHIGASSTLNMILEQNKLTSDGGLLKVEPFI